MIFYITSYFFFIFLFYSIFIFKINTLNTSSDNICFIYTPSPYLGDIIVILFDGVLHSIVDTKPRDEFAYLKGFFPYFDSFFISFSNYVFLT